MTVVQELIADLRNSAEYSSTEGFCWRTMRQAADTLERMCRVLEMVRQYPDFDGGGPLPDAIDAVLSGAPETKGEALLRHIDDSTKG